MTTDILMYLAAFGGGFLGATFGALFAFSFVGITLIVGIAVAIATGGDASWINLVSFGPFFGPHISFAGGVGAAAYAHRRGYLTGLRDIATPLVSLAKPDVLIVGGLFGVGGLVVSDIVSIIPWLGTHTDLPGITVIISGIAARLIFGKTGIIGPNSEGLTGKARFTPNDTDCWVRYQEGWGNVAVLGLGTGLLSAWATIALSEAFPDAAASIPLLGFGISAASLMFLTLGAGIPVTHHMTLIAAISASNFLAITGNPVAAVLIGCLFGGISALVGEGFSRLWQIRGDTHIDPPASAIWPMTCVVLGLTQIFA
ncbi:hypothetical protein [Propionimicrobium sp. PCR01-08-3]|uniref:hypothetical protein n=1 Tax=Propionimicrobium sp. PCR01-08-3 TaxID=3052086 RepID=UPI00255CAF04|nr:hypothetical protein [Propionimicrobium sp. PCR01-08-3]WIY84025.1 hypothetical protein QQ658_06725 [Propionimicrobium sp. PCR01-08-3]